MEAAARLVGGWDDGSTTRKALAALGVQIEADAVPVGESLLDIWPDNDKPVKVFRRMLTQWAVSMGGVVGLRYESLPIILEVCEVTQSERGEVIDCLQVMERHAVTLMNKEGGSRG